VDPERDLGGVAFLLDTEGRVGEILSGPFETSGGGTGNLFTDGLDEGSRAKGAAFLDEVRNQGGAFDWELVLPAPETDAVLHFAGVRLDDKMLVIGARTRLDLLPLFERAAEISHLQTDLFRAAMKGLTRFAAGGATASAPNYDEIMRLNNEMTNLQREVSRKNAELERMNETQRRRVTELDALYKATTSLLRTIDLESLLDGILSSAMEAIPVAEKGALLLCAPGTRDLAVRASRGFEAPEVAVSRAFASPSMSKVVERGKPLLIEDIRWESDSGLKPSVPEVRSLRSHLLIPLAYGEDKQGLLALGSKRPKAFTFDDFRLVEAFAAAASAALQNGRLHAEVREMAVTDALTGILNRRGFFSQAHRDFERARRFGRPFVLVMIDIDHFKRINDAYGHPAGDEVLKTLAAAFKAQIRGTDLLGRFGGDEFILLLAETSLANGLIFAGRARESVNALAVPVANGPLRITVSQGLSAFDPGCPDIDALVGRADQALYRAKTAGRDRWESFSA
jgi:diguanylate cyclase (GGDEF)-like protein